MDTRRTTAKDTSIGIVFKSCIVIGLCLLLNVVINPLPSNAAPAIGSSASGFSFVAMLKGVSSSRRISGTGVEESVASGFVDFILHLDLHLGSMIARHGAMSYVFLFGIVFCETGLVLTPFLPGDSLLFVAGALAGLDILNIFLLAPVFITAAILGDAVNYAVGLWIGEKAVAANVISKAYIQKTERFFKNYGGKTIVLARFVPIVRTFAPFVAGMSHMEYRKFASFNIGGAFLWTILFCGAGYFFGNLPFVEKNFSLVVLVIVIISILPVVYEILAANQEQPNPKTSSNPQT